jgi:hypothetical protein
MTQFMLCDPIAAKPSGEVYFRALNEDESFLAIAAQSLFPSGTLIRVPVLLTGQSIADLFTEAHNAVYNGIDYSTSRLSAVMPELVRLCKSFALWWGDDWSDLPIIRTESAIEPTLIQQLSQPVGEVYLRWQKP